MPPEWSRPLGLKTFALVGLVPEEIVGIVELFASGGRDLLSGALREQAGFPWAHAFEQEWERDEAEARRRGLFDLIWHRRALEMDPIITARYFEGFDILLETARELAPEPAAILAHIDGNDERNPRRNDGPDWCRAWHQGAGTCCGGWLDAEETRAIAQMWHEVSTPEVEQVCVELLGATYTHQGCWTLLSDLGGFFAQCATESRGIVIELDDA